MQNSVFYQFGPRLYPPHGLYLIGVSGQVKSCYFQGPLGAKPYGISGVQLKDCPNLRLSDCTAENCRVGNDGYGFIIWNGGNYVFERCVATVNNYAGFYEVGFHGTVQYIDCQGTKR